MALTGNRSTYGAVLDATWKAVRNAIGPSMAGSITIIARSCHAGPGSLKHRLCIRLSTRRVLRPSAMAVPVIGLWGRLAFANLPPRKV